MRTTLFFFLLAGILAAQPITFGVKGGLRLTGDQASDSPSESKPYVVGPMVTAKLPLGFRLEFDALYRRVGYRSTEIDLVGDLVNSRARGNSWEFPILVRRTFWHGVYAGIGYAPRVINGGGHSAGLYVTSLSPLQKVFRENDFSGEWDTTHGLVTAAGIERRVGPLLIAPEFRYTYWNQPSITAGGYHTVLVLGAQHQADAMIGIHFPAGRR
jgi:hypothetical protein